MKSATKRNSLGWTSARVLALCAGLASASVARAGEADGRDAASAGVLTGDSAGTAGLTEAQRAEAARQARENELVVGDNGLLQRQELRQPEWVAEVLSPGYDAAYQDQRTQAFIHQELARVIADSRYPVHMGDPETDYPSFSSCFAPGTTISPDMMAAINEALMGSFEERYFVGGSWNSGSVNARRTLTWSFVPDGVTVVGGPGGNGNSTLFATLDAQFANNGGRATWIAQFEAIFARWTALSGLDYVRRTAAGVDWDDGAAWGNSGSTTRGDLRIAAKFIDGGGGILAYNQFPGSGSGGDMVIDNGDTWDATANAYRFFRNTLGHEHGHGLGLSHSCPVNETKLMEPFLSTAFDGPQQDDIRGAQYNYGDINEPNNLATQFTDLGTLANGSTTTLGAVPAPAVANGSTLSIVNRASPAYTDLDWYRLTLDTPRLVTFNLNVVGSTYLNSPQNNPGAPDGCAAGTNFNARAVQDLRFIVYRSDGTTQLAAINAGAAGTNESVAQLLLPSGNNFYVVTSATTLEGTQLYNSTISVLTTNILVNATDGTFTDKVRVTWSPVPNAANYRIRRNTVDSFSGSTNLGTLAAPATQFDDTTAVPGTTYFYFLEVNQTFGSSYVVTSASGETGSRGVPANTPPTANAGSDQTVTDSDNSGSEAVTLNGTLSSDVEGPIASYAWTRNGSPILNVATGSVTLPVGVNTIVLTVTDSGGLTGTDSVIITVNPGGPVCDGIDFNNDGSVFDPVDIEAFLSVYGEGPCVPASATCNDIDFNNDSSIFDPRDIESFLSVYGEGPCL